MEDFLVRYTRWGIQREGIRQLGQSMMGNPSLLREGKLMLVGQKWTPTNQLHNTLHSEMTGLTFGQPTHKLLLPALSYLILSVWKPPSIIDYPKPQELKTKLPTEDPPMNRPVGQHAKLIELGVPDRSCT